MYKGSDRNFKMYLQDMVDAIDAIQSYTADLDFEKFITSRMAADAVIRNFEIIGEAANNIPEEIQQDYPAIPWRKMYGLRNMITHEYFGIDYSTIWEITKNSLHQNKIDLIKLLEEVK
jgi:uncharacterized protein with HEPN domain